MSARRKRVVWRSGAILMLCASALHISPGFASIEPPDDGVAMPRILSGFGGDRLAQAAGDSTETSAVSPYLDPAPNIFEATGLAQWDGKRTLQGIWVAHPLATTARRVRIFNTANGRAVDGALFKRDAALSGTSVLISSEAAQLLGMTPGISAELRIVAVTPAARRDPPEQPAEDVAIDETDTPVAPETKPAAEDTPAVAPKEETPAAVAETETAAPATPEPEPEKEPAQLAARSPTPKARPEAAQPEPEPEPAPAPALQTQGTGEAEPFKWVPGLPKEETAAVAKPEPEPEPVAVAEPAKPEAPKEAAPKSSPLRLPFVQAGIFGVPGNATKLVARLEKRGIPALTRKTRNGKLTRVLAGPFMSSSERSTAQRAIRRMGLRDAVPVRK